MVFRIIKKIQAQTGRNNFLYLLALLGAFSAFNCVLFLLIYFLPFFLILIIILFFGLLFFIISRARRDKKNRRDLMKELEKEIFGKRTLIIDSLFEFEEKKIETGTTLELSRDLEKNPAFGNFIQKKKKELAWKSLLYLIIILISAGAVFFMFRPVFLKGKEITRFISDTASPGLPDFYSEGKEFGIDLSPLYRAYDHVKLIIDENEIEGEKGVFKIHEEFTGRGSFSLVIKIEKFGLVKTIIKKSLYAVSRLFPQKAAVTVIYPAGSGLSAEEYAGLQDLEVWQGAEIKISGEMTKELSGIIFSNGMERDLKISGRNFSFRFKPLRTRSYHLELKSIDGDSFEFPDFTIKIVPNSPPVLRLLFPLSDIVLSYYPWKVLSIIEGEDDQGIKEITVEIIITNRDINLSKYSKKIISRHPQSGGKYIKQNFPFDSASLELLPNDAASIKFTASDVFGSKSMPVGFNIISPDLMDLKKRWDNEEKNIVDMVGKISNLYESMQKDINEKNTSRLDQKAGEIESGVQKLNDSLTRLDNSSFTSEAKEMQETLKELRDITGQLAKNSEELKKWADFMQNKDVQYENKDIGKLGIKEYLKQISSLMKNLEYYQKYRGLLTQFQLAKNTYEALKKREEKESFNESLKSYRKELTDLGKMGNDTTAALTSRLVEESKKWDKKEDRSYVQSDALMKQLENEIRNQITDAGKERIREKMDRLQKALQEIYITVIFIERSKKLDMGTSGSPDIDRVNTEVEIVTSINNSAKYLKRELDGILEGLVIKPASISNKNGNDPGEEMVKEMENIQDDISSIQTFLRDYKIENVKYILNDLENGYTSLFLSLLRLNSALNGAMEKKQNGEAPDAMMTLEMGDLLKMQAMVSEGLKQLSERLEREGKLSSEAKQMMDELGRLQSEILKNLQKLLKEGQGGAYSGGNDMAKDMEDIIKNLQSYSIKNETLEKSKKLEEKMLSNQKSLQNKGISQERKAETAKTYTVVPPATNAVETPEKIDLDSLPDKNISDYYKKLLEKYHKTAQ